MKAFVLILIILLPAHPMAQVYKKHSVQKDRVIIQLNEGVLEFIPLSEKSIRVQLHKNGLKETQELILINKLPVPQFHVTVTPVQLKVSTKAITATLIKNTGALVFADSKGKVFLQERAGSRKVTQDSVLGQKCLIAEQSFLSSLDEALFGLGQFQDGNFNLKNVSRKLTQVNTQISVPFLYSSKGYGILWHQYGLTYFNPPGNVVMLTKKDTLTGTKGDAEVTTTAGTQRISQQQALYQGTFKTEHEGKYSFLLDLGDMDNRHLLIIDGVAQIDQSNLWLPPSAGKIVELKAGVHQVQIVCKASNTPKLNWKPVDDLTTFRSPNAKALDYVVFKGDHADEVIRNYRELSGQVPMLPLWAYGFWQCRERYTSGAHLVETVKEFRKRNLPIDVIVQDWQYWGKYGWGVPKFDEANYPEPEKFIKELHDLKARFSISVWENLDKKSEVAKAYTSKNLYIPNSPWIDIFNPQTQQTHWNALNKNLFTYGVDSWWMDATEPENDALAGKQTYLGLGDFYRLTYPLFVSKAVYEGQRRTDPQKRVAILTRSAFAGQQRYGTINWSGDIGWTWDTFQRQIVAGLNYNMTGMPYWTTDIGGFFRPGRSQYTDEKYHDLLIRWFQWGAFNPIFRIHGYQSETEPWKYGEKVENSMRKMLNLRYQLMPYIYSTAWQVSNNGSTMMRPLVMDFAKDKNAVEQRYEYMFGSSLLVAPVIQANIKQWEVYLPGPADWFDWWTGQKHQGGKSVTTAAPQDKIPLFVKAGSIIPFGQPLQYTARKPADSLEIRIYEGANGKFEMYEDEGDNYNYEKGIFSLIKFNWNNAAKTLSIAPPTGNHFAGEIKKRHFTLVLFKDTGDSATMPVDYNGKGLNINFK